MDSAASEAAMALALHRRQGGQAALLLALQRQLRLIREDRSHVQPQMTGKRREVAEPRPTLPNLT